MNFRYVREFYAAVNVSKALNERRRPNATDLETLGLRAEQFSHYGRR
jgi:hypothetical protein